MIDMDGVEWVPKARLTEAQAFIYCFAAVENTLARHCRGFMDRPTTHGNLPDLIDLMCESDLRHLQEKQETAKRLIEAQAEIVRLKEDLNFLHERRWTSAVANITADPSAVESRVEGAIDLVRDLWRHHKLYPGCRTEDSLTARIEAFLASSAVPKKEKI